MKIGQFRQEISQISPFLGGSARPHTLNNVLYLHVVSPARSVVPEASVGYRQGQGGLESKKTSLQSASYLRENWDLRGQRRHDQPRPVTILLPFACFCHFAAVYGSVSVRSDERQNTKKSSHFCGQEPEDIQGAWHPWGSYGLRPCVGWQLRSSI